MAKRFYILILMFCLAWCSYAQTIRPVVTLYNKEEMQTDTIADGSTASIEAPLDITCLANIYCPSNYSYRLEWNIVREELGVKDSPITRFDEKVEYTIDQKGTYIITLSVTFYDAFGGEIETQSEGIRLTVKESKLTVGNAFSPNGDEFNEKLKIECQSIVKCTGIIFNRWGQKLHTFTVENLADGWDGMVNGKPVANGVYFLNIDAYGAEGLHYKIKKAINVMTNFRENTEGGPTE